MALVLASAGIESTVLLWDMWQHPSRYGLVEKDPIVALFFNLGTPAHIVCGQCLQELSVRMKGRIRLTIHDCTNLPMDRDMTVWEADPSIDLGDDGLALTGSYTSYRFVYFYTLAAMYAHSMGESQFYSGLLKTDGGIWDGSASKDVDKKGIQELLDILKKDSNVERMGIVTPFSHLNKRDVVRLGMEIGAPLELTYSCEYGPHRCGKCFICRSVAAACVSVMGIMPKWRFG